MKIHTEKRHILRIQAADAAFQARLIRIRNGEAPQPAIKAVMRQFNAGITSDLAKVFSALLATKLGVGGHARPHRAASRLYRLAKPGVDEPGSD